jgi:hypothetical protein
MNIEKGKGSHVGKAERIDTEQVEERGDKGRQRNIANRGQGGDYRERKGDEEADSNSSIDDTSMRRERGEHATTPDIEAEEKEANNLEIAARGDKLPAAFDSTLEEETMNICVRVCVVEEESEIILGDANRGGDRPPRIVQERRERKRQERADEGDQDREREENHTRDEDSTLTASVE